MNIFVYVEGKKNIKHLFLISSGNRNSYYRKKNIYFFLLINAMNFNGHKDIFLSFLTVKKINMSYL